MMISLLSIVPTRFYVIIKTLYSRLHGQKMRFTMNDGKIQIQEGKIFWTAPRSRCHLYSLGLVNRGESIGKSYQLEKIEFKRKDFIIDCGANMGDLQLYFVAVGLEVNYIGIEPNPLDYSYLKYNLKSESKALNVALWNVSEELQFFVDAASSSSSIIEPKKFDSTIIIHAKRLDSIDLPQRIKLLKIEGEGAEPEILLGSESILDRVEYISVDSGPERGTKEDSTSASVLNYLINRNFEVVSLNRGHRETILFKNRKIA